MKLKPNSFVPPFSMTKKLRTNRPRRNRTHFSPILYPDASSDHSHSLSSTLTSNSTLNKRLKLNDLSFLPISKTDPNDAVSETSCVESNGKEWSLNDLGCREELCYEEVAYGSCASSELELSDYSPSSLFYDSGSEFSEKSESDESSNTFHLLSHFRRLFLPFSTSLHHSTPHLFHNSVLEDAEEEESYKLLRERERKVYKHDYVQSYRSTTDCGELLFHQRLQMIHWIIQQSKANEYEEETMFLGVSLLDRFLSKGFFKTKRNLQILGISCLTLATRIEENQPYNTIRKKSFCIGNNQYSRHEVVAMEWLVQEVLNFQCYTPTICNFMGFYLKAAKADAELEKRARHLAVVAQSDHQHLAYWPSTVAACLVILACVETNHMDSYQRVIEVHVRTKENDLHECIENLEWLLQCVK